MRELSKEEIENLSWSDAEFHGFHWAKETSEPTLSIIITPCNTAVIELICCWATDLTVDLAYNNRVGPLLTWDVKITQAENETWKIFIDLAHEGEISFMCNKLFVRTSLGE